MTKEETNTEVRGPIPFLGFDPENGTINLPDGRVAAYMAQSAHEADPTLGHKMAAAPELVVALRTIAEMPIPEQDNMISANMRIIARTALAKATAP